MSKIINKILESESFRGTILIAKDQEIILEKGYGIANNTNKLSNGTNIVYRIGSLAKQFTALSVLQLVEQGLLRLEDPIYKYVPTHNLFKFITIHQLLVHSSGLPEDFPYNWYVDFNNIGILEALKPLNVESLESQKPLYSNVGYSILEHLIEIVSDYTYSEYISKHICESLGLINTGSDMNNYCAINKRANGYELGEKSRQMLFKMYEGAGSSFYSTANEYRKWDISLYNDVLLSDKYKNLMFKCHEPISNDVGYGYGWEVNRFHPTIHQHTGYVAGISSIAIRNEKNKFLLFAVSNSGKEGLKPIQLINDTINKLIV